MAEQQDKVGRREDWGGDSGSLVGVTEAPGRGQGPQSPMDMADGDPTWGGSPHLLPRATMGAAPSWHCPPHSACDMMAVSQVRKPVGQGVSRTRDFPFHQRDKAVGTSSGGHTQPPRPETNRGPSPPAPKAPPPPSTAREDRAAGLGPEVAAGHRWELWPAMSPAGPRALSMGRWRGGGQLQTQADPGQPKCKSATGVTS